MQNLHFWCENKYGTTIDQRRNKSNGTRNMKNVNLYLKTSKNILSSHKTSKKYNEQWGVLKKKLFLKIYKETNVLESLF